MSLDRDHNHELLMSMEALDKFQEVPEGEDFTLVRNWIELCCIEIACAVVGMDPNDVEPFLNNTLKAALPSISAAFRATYGLGMTHRPLPDAYRKFDVNGTDTGRIDT